MNSEEKKVYVSALCGFCAGVERALGLVESALGHADARVYVLHEIVHNSHVVSDLQKRGVIFVEELSEIPPGETVIFSAHGVTVETVREAERRKLKIVDATCPLVRAIHHEVTRLDQEGCAVLFIGHGGHPETEGTLGQLAGSGRIFLVESESDLTPLRYLDGRALAVLSQTTLDSRRVEEICAAIKETFPASAITFAARSCYATDERQRLARKLAEMVDLLLVIGSRNSSNSNRLCEVGREAGATAQLIEDEDDITEAMMTDCRAVGVTAGASAPEIVVKRVLKRLEEFGFTDIEVAALND